MNLAKRFGALLLIAFIAGCSHKNIDTTKLQAAFTSNGAVSDDLVTQGVDAISKTNYPVALESLEKLAYRQHVSKEQRVAIQDVIAQLKERIRKGQ
jgi:outer membrane protein assembly factor BamD (BamD/ComL family)